jgi:hypothetical protein
MLEPGRRSVLQCPAADRTEAGPAVMTCACGRHSACDAKLRARAFGAGIRALGCESTAACSMRWLCSVTDASPPIAGTSATTVVVSAPQYASASHANSNPGREQALAGELEATR